MKKIFWILVISILSLTFFYYFKHNAIVAQENNYDEVVQQAIDDYLFQFNKYNIAHQEYTKAKNAYIKYATVASQREAVTKAKEVAILRAESLRIYLQLLKTIINNQKYIDTSLKSTQTQKIETMQNFINTHKLNMENTSNISQVNSESENFEKEITEITNTAYESLCIILIGEMQDMEARSKQILAHFEREFASVDDEKVKQGINEVNENLASYRKAIENAHQDVLQYRDSLTGKRSINALTTHKRVKQEVTNSLGILDSIAILFNEFEVRIEQWPN